MRVNKRWLRKIWQMVKNLRKHHLYILFRLRHNSFRTDRTRHLNIQNVNSRRFNFQFHFFDLNYLEYFCFFKKEGPSCGNSKQHYGISIIHDRHQSPVVLITSLSLLSIAREFIRNCPSRMQIFFCWGGFSFGIKLALCLMWLGKILQAKLLTMNILPGMI